MIAASSLAFPGSKPLAIWWRQLASFDPCALWVGHLLLHRLEVLAEFVAAEKTDLLTRLVLEAFALDHAAPQPLPEQGNDALWLHRLDNRLHLGRGVIARLVRSLQEQGLLNSRPALTELGRLVVETGHYPRRGWQRREMVFMERPRPDGQRLLPPHFLPLHGGNGPAWQPDERSRFNLDGLFACLKQPPAWKEQWGFAAETLNVADPAQPGDDPPPWQRVVIDRPERLLLVLIASGPEQKLLGFAVRQDGWELHHRDPILTLPWPTQAEFPDLAQNLAQEPWTAAWEAWCKARAVPVVEIQACTLHFLAGKLTIHVPATLHGRLAAAKNEALHGDTWLLAGVGYLRPAAQMHIVVQ